mgnify:CR=1 FL=1
MRAAQGRRERRSLEERVQALASKERHFSDEMLGQSPAMQRVFELAQVAARSNSTILTEYLRLAKIKPSLKLATALFYAIKTDTHNFERPSTEADVRAFHYLFAFTRHALVRRIEIAELPKTISGKIRRVELRKRAAEGLDLGAIRRLDAAFQRQRAPARRGEPNRDARPGVAERLDDVAGQALEPVDVAPRGAPGPEIRGEPVGRRGERRQLQAVVRRR